MRRLLVPVLVATVALSVGCATADWRLHVPHSTPAYADNKILLFSSETTGIIAYNVSTQTKLWTQPAPCPAMPSARSDYNSTYLFRRTGPSTISYSCGAPITSEMDVIGQASLDDVTGTVIVSQPVTKGWTSVLQQPSAAGDVVSGTYCVFTWPPVCLLGGTKAVWSPAFESSAATVGDTPMHLHNGTLVVVKGSTPYIFDAATGALRAIAGGRVSPFSTVAFYKDLTVLIQGNAFGSARTISVSIVDNTDGSVLVTNSPLAGAPAMNSDIVGPVVFEADASDSSKAAVMVGLVLDATYSYGATALSTNFTTWRVSLSPALAPDAVAPMVYSVAMAPSQTSSAMCGETSGYIMCSSADFSVSTPSVLLHAQSGAVVDASGASGVVSLATLTSFETQGGALIAQGTPSYSASAEDVWTVAFERSSGSFLWLRALSSIGGTVGYDVTGDCVVLLTTTGAATCVELRAD